MYNDRSGELADIEQALEGLSGAFSASYHMQMAFVCARISLEQARSLNGIAMSLEALAAAPISPVEKARWLAGFRSEDEQKL